MGYAVKKVKSIVNTALVLGGLYALADIFLLSPNPDQYRDHVLQKNGPFVTQIARYGAHNRGLSANELEPIFGDAVREFPADRNDLGELIDDNREEFEAVLEGMVEGTISELMGEEVDFSSPYVEPGTLKVYIMHRNSQRFVYEEIDIGPMSTSSYAKLALEYLYAHIGPEKAEEFSYDDEKVKAFSDEFELYLNNSNLNNDQNLLQNLRSLESSVYEGMGLSPKDVKFNDENYDVIVSRIIGQMTTFLGWSFYSLDDSSSNRSARRLLGSAFHETGHLLIGYEGDELGFWDYFKVDLRDEEHKTIRESASEVIESVALQHFEKNRLGDIDPSILDMYFTKDIKRISSSEMEKYWDLYDAPRDKNEARLGSIARYESLQDELTIIMDEYGFGDFVRIVAQLRTFEQVNQIVSMAETERSLEDVLKEIEQM